MASKNQKKNVKKNNSFSPAVIVAIVIAALAVAAIVIAAVSLSKANDETSSSAPVVSDVSASETSREIIPAKEDEPSGYAEELAIGEFNDSHSYVQFEMDDGGKIVMELYPEIAPITVTNFMDLVDSGFYDGLTIHRVSKGFVIQGGDPKGNGTGGSGKNITGEFEINGIENNLSHLRGVVSMARNSKDYNSASSQFFIVLANDKTSSLDGMYAGFGKVIVGMDVVDSIAAVATYQEMPFTPVVIKKATVLHFAGETAAQAGD